MPEYEVRLYRADDTLSIVMKSFANGPLEIQAAAAAMLKGNIVRAEVWCDHQHIETLKTTETITSKYEPRSQSGPYV
jgi:hypothetical protein